MKNLFLFLSCLTILSSCKKGPDDPLISLHTRKARLVGDWKVSTYKLTGVFDDFFADENLGPATKRNITVDNNTISATYSDSIYPVGVFPLANKPVRQYQTIVDAGTINTNTITFSKDGTWARTFSYTITRTQFLSVTHNYNNTFECIKNVSNHEYTYQSSGKWKFINKDHYRNKECISLTKLVETYKADSWAAFQLSNGYSSNMAFVDGTHVQEWKLVGLHNKKLEFEVLGSYNELFDMDDTNFTEESGTYEQ